MLAMSFRVSPWTLRARRESSRRCTTAVLPSTVIDTSGSRVRVRVPFGPSTRIVPSLTCSFTASGMVTGRRPMRDMASSGVLRDRVRCRRHRRSPDLADHLAAHALAACLAVREDALGRRQDAHAEPPAHRRDLAGADVDTQARTAHPKDAGDHRAAGLIVAQPEPEGRELPLLYHRGVREVALLDEDAGDGLLVPRPRHVDAGLARTRAVADAGQHVGDGIGHHGRITSSPSRGPGSDPCGRGRAGRGGTSGSDGRTPADVRTAGSGCTPGPGTSGAGTLSP